MKAMLVTPGRIVRRPQSGEQLWRRFLFCLQPDRLAVASKYSMLSLRGVSLLLAFLAKSSFLCKVYHQPSDSPNVHYRQYKTDHDSLFVSRVLLSSDLLLSSDQHFHYFRSHIKIILISFVWKATLIKRTEES